MVAESSELPEVAERNQPGGEAELTLEGGDCRVTVRGPERASEEPNEWAKALLSAYDVWRQMYATVHAGRLEEIRAEQSGPVVSGSAGFIQESSPERRNQSLPGGTGARTAGMKGVVVEIPNATIEMEFSPAEDEHDRDLLTFRFHNEEGQHCLVRIASPRLLILDDGQELEYPS